MRLSGFWALLIVLGTTLTFFRSSLFPDLVSTNCADSSPMIAVNRKLKENDSGISSKKKVDMGNVSVEDYNPIDPAPSSKASLKPGPIEHGSPLNPYIPRPSPPAAPTPGDFN